MNSTTKITAEQKGTLLQELLSFLIAMNGKATKDNVSERLLNKSLALKIKLQDEEHLALVENISSMCVRAEWITKSGFWKVTKYGKRALEQFSSPKVLFQEMAVQSVFRRDQNSRKENRNSKTKVLALLLILSPCVFLGFFFNSQHLFLLASFSLIILLLAIALYDARTKLIFLGRILSIEFMILCATMLLDLLFAATSAGKYFYTYFFAVLGVQVISMVSVFLSPRFFSRLSEYVNQSKWLIFILILLLAILFGGYYGGGLLEMLYGKDVATVAYTIVFAVLAGLGLIYILGGIATNLLRAGYFD